MLANNILTSYRELPVEPEAEERTPSVFSFENQQRTVQCKITGEK